MANGNGLFIVLYGPSGVGKSKQLQLLENRFSQMQIATKTVEYPLVDLEPVGPKIKKIVWGMDERPSEEEMQEMFSQNRRDFEPTLKSWLSSGMVVLAENYKGTGMVWGVTRGIGVEKMEKINEGFLDPDISILIDGPRRLDLRPGEGTIYDVDEDEWYKARKVYLQMADKYGWIRVGGDAPILTVDTRIWSIIRPVIDLRRR